ncbi:DUF6177 family protein [Streptomyces xiamenensis]|uniref:DUF6177 family protein n=1 Tax=Streptomyces xiamenensis TaxID=408015 RepID=UPI00341ECBFF
MTTDATALTERRPDDDALRYALSAAGPGRALDATEGGGLLRVRDAAGHPLLAIGAPTEIAVPGEARRLLGPGAPTGPVWWTEVRTTLPGARGAALAGRFTARLAERLGGTAWPDPTRHDPGGPADTGAAPVPAAAHPAIDALTATSAVLLQDRPVVGVSPWLQDALRAVHESGRTLYLVTPEHTRLTLPLYELLPTQPLRWVVRYGETFYDGFTGAALTWRDGGYAERTGPDGQPVLAAAWHDSRLPYLDDPHGPELISRHNALAGSAERRLTFHVRTRHNAREDLVLGGALEAVWRAVTGGPPAGWGPAEPAGRPWSRAELTALARERAPEPSYLLVTGGDAAASAALRIARTTAGVEEEATLTFGFASADSVPLQELPGIAAELAARHGLRTLRVTWRATDAAPACAPLFPGLPAPLGFALGAGEPTAPRGGEPLPVTALPLGPAGRDGQWYPFGGGVEHWQDFRTLIGRLSRPMTDWSDGMTG